MHWADQYVGLLAAGPDPCWLLVRKVWAECCGVELPRFDGTDDPETVFRREAIARGFREIPLGQEQDFDAVMMLEPVRVGSTLRSQERHIGVVAGKGFALHATSSAPACVEPFGILTVSRILRGPWASP